MSNQGNQSPANVSNSSIRSSDSNESISTGGTPSASAPAPESTPSTGSDSQQRYSRQIRFSQLGVQGQQRIAAAKAVLIGCGALGTAIANTLVRSGLGSLTIVDRDFVEISNLQRQSLFDETDVAQNLPKSVAAVAKLKQINSQVNLTPIVADVDATNIQPLIGDTDMILDGSDNFEIRFLINDVAIKQGIPWVFGGCLGADGQTMTILPGETPCLSCLMPQGPPPPGTSPTCDAQGILGTIIQVIAAIEANEAIKILSGNRHAINRNLTSISLWDNRFQQIDLSRLNQSKNCVTCHQRQFQYLSGQRTSISEVLCGRNAVQLNFPGQSSIDLPALAQRLQSVGVVHFNPYLLKLQVDTYVITVFSDGRGIVSGTDDPLIARKLFAQYLG